MSKLFFLELEFQDLVAAMRIVKPSAMREVMLEIPSVRWDDIGGQAELKQQLREAIEWPLQMPHIFEQMGISTPKGLLLFGPPGCSKTLMAKALATEASLNFLAVKGPELFSKWVGDSEKAVRDLFRKARMAAPSIIFFDEIDALAVERGSADSSASDRVLSQLLLEMDGVVTLRNVTVIAATNRPDLLDKALLRPGRFDRMLYVPPPDESARRAIVEMHLAKVPHGIGIDIDGIVKSSAGFSGADVVQLCREASLAALHASLDEPSIEDAHFTDAFKRVGSSLSRDLMQFYDSYRSGR